MDCVDGRARATAATPMHRMKRPAPAIFIGLRLAFSGTIYFLQPPLGAHCPRAFRPPQPMYGLRKICGGARGSSRSSFPAEPPLGKGVRQGGIQLRILLLAW